jgi:hypothetical protein
MKNKKGAAEISGGMILIIAVVIIGVVWFMSSQNAAPANPNNPSPNNNQGNTNNPSLGYAGVNAITNAALTLGTTNMVVTNAQGSHAATNTTYTAVAGDSLVLLNDPTGYLADSQTVSSIVNGPQVVTFKPYAYANVSMTFKDDPVSSSNTLSQDATPTNNLTKVAAGGSRKIGMILQGTTQKSTGKQFWTIETPANTGTNISSISVTCGGSQVNLVSLPGCLTAVNAASKIIAFEVPAIVGFGETDCTVNVQTTATGALGAGTYLFKEYAEQKFFDSSNVLEEGICDTTTNGNNAVEYQDYQAHYITMNA